MNQSSATDDDETNQKYIVAYHQATIVITWRCAVSERRKWSVADSTGDRGQASAMAWGVQ